MNSEFEPHCDNCGAEKARCRSRLNDQPLCTNCKEKQNKLCKEWMARSEPGRREADMAALRAGLNPYV